MIIGGGATGPREAGVGWTGLRFLLTCEAIQAWHEGRGFNGPTDRPPVDPCCARFNEPRGEGREVSGLSRPAALLLPPVSHMPGGTRAPS